MVTVIIGLGAAFRTDHNVYLRTEHMFYQNRLHLCAVVCLLAWTFVWGCSAPPAPPAPDEGPSANAGPDQTVKLGDSVTLDGSSSSDPKDRILEYSWSASPNNPASVVLSSGSIISFVLPSPGNYVFSLTVTADKIASVMDSVRIVVKSDDSSPPVSNAGIDAIYPLDAVAFLDGSGHDVDGDSLSFSWTLTSGPDSVAIANPADVQTSFSAIADGHYTFRLAVSDSIFTSYDDVVIIITPADNIPPISNAGPDQTVNRGSLVHLNGSLSTNPDSVGQLAFQWSIGRTPGEAVQLSNFDTATPSFVPNQLGEYVFGLTVNNGKVTGFQDLVIILVVDQAFAQRGGMIEIPNGQFIMGTDGEASFADQRPAHTVTVSTFWIDSVEVTTSQYQLCSNTGECTSAGQRPGCNAGRNDRDDHPINCVTWDQANTFCIWAGKRLPTEAEWEKAARGDDERLYPWGNTDPHLRLLEDPNLKLLNFNDNMGTTDVVGNYPDGRSYYGAHNMAGNVMEWTGDYFDRSYYSESPAIDPRGPEDGSLRVARGGFFGVGFSEAISTTVRNATPPTASEPGLGFRCVRTDTP